MRALVYVVDDELLLAQIMEAILRMEGYEVKMFSRPDAALESFAREEEKPALLITDYVMQPMNGLELIGRCRGIHPGIRTIVVSGNTGSDILGADGQRPDAFVRKPFLPTVLAREVRSLVSQVSA